jgi:cytochrome P450
MTVPTHASGARELHAQQLATADRPAEEHAQLRDRGVHRRQGGWVVARREDVAAALASPVLGVAGPVAAGAAPQGDARLLQARMARFTDGPQHTGRRALLEQLMPTAAGLEVEAGRQAAAALRGRTGTVDAMPLARTVPVLVLAAALGVPVADRPRVEALTGLLCDALAPSLAAPATGAAEDEAASALIGLLQPVGPWNDEEVAAAAGLLFQARDATAALIGTALLAHPALRDPAVAVERALRQHAPVQCTRRTALADVQLGGATVPRGGPVWVVLAAAEQGAPSQPATFGAGPHTCPGAEHAVALARGVLTGLGAAGWQPVAGQDVRYEPRPNLRMPAVVLVEQA